MSIFRVGYIDWYCLAKALYLQQRMILIYFCNHSCTLVTLFIFVCISTQMKNSSTENNFIGWTIFPPFSGGEVGTTRNAHVQKEISPLKEVSESRRV